MFRNHCVVQINVKTACLIQTHCFGLISLDHSHRQIAMVSFLNGHKLFEKILFDRPQHAMLLDFCFNDRLLVCESNF